MLSHDLKYSSRALNCRRCQKAGVDALAPGLVAVVCVCARVPSHPPASGDGVERLLFLLCLSREEAKEMWEKREAEWAREQIARDKLMSEVIPNGTLFLVYPTWI